MRKFLVILTLALISVGFSGCATLSQTSDERSARISSIEKKEWKMLVEDWDNFWMIDRPTRLSKKNI